MYYDSNVNGKKKFKRSIIAILFVLAMVCTMSVAIADQPVIAEGEKIPTFN